MDADHEMCSNQVFLDKTRPDILRMLAIFYKMTEWFIAYPSRYKPPKDLPWPTRNMTAPMYGEKEYWWIACEVARLPCIDSFIEVGAAVLSKPRNLLQMEYPKHPDRDLNGTLVWCGATAHFYPQTDILLGANAPDTF